MGSVDVRTEIIVNRPREAVAAYAADPDKAPEWYVNIQTAEWQTPKPLSQGSRISFTARFLGRTLAYTYEVTHYEPGRKLVMRTAQGPFPMETTYEWFDAGPGQTRMTLRNTGSPKGFSALFAPFMKTAMRKANQKDLERLKQLLESTHT